MSTDPYEDVYRLLSTSKQYGKTPARVDMTETVATINVMMESSIHTTAISFADVDIQLKHHEGRDKWVVLYKPDGKLLIRLESPDAKHANALAMALATVKATVTEQ